MIKLSVFFWPAAGLNLEPISFGMKPYNAKELPRSSRSRVAKYQNEFYLINPDAEHRGILLIKK
jgi:hypothetical protein